MDTDSSNFFQSKDKQIVPFLFTQPDVSFIGTKQFENITFFLFTPYERCIELVNAYVTRKAPLVQPKELLDAIETYRDMVFGMKMKEKVYGEH